MLEINGIYTNPKNAEMIRQAKHNSTLAARQQRSRHHAQAAELFNQAAIDLKPVLENMIKEPEFGDNKTHLIKAITTMRRKAAENYLAIDDYNRAALQLRLAGRSIGLLEKNLSPNDPLARQLAEQAVDSHLTAISYLRQSDPTDTELANFLSETSLAFDELLINFHVEEGDDLLAAAVFCRIEALLLFRKFDPNKLIAEKERLFTLIRYSNPAVPMLIADTVEWAGEAIPRLHPNIYMTPFTNLIQKLAFLFRTKGLDSLRSYYKDLCYEAADYLELQIFVIQTMLKDRHISWSQTPVSILD